MADVLTISGLKKYFPIKSGVFSSTVGHVKAVDGVSFSIPHGETFGLVGESGCGKTTVGKTLLRLIEPTEGRVVFNGIDVFRLPNEQMRGMRRHLQIVFQDPFSSLNPTMTVKNIVGEPMKIHNLAHGNQRYYKTLELLNTVGLREEHMNRFPHEFSGGQRQRICIARALAMNPNFIVLDEPTSALDVSVQAQILNLLKDLQARMSLTYLFISHDLSVIKHISHKVGVMYLGRMVEVAPTEDLFARPLHPYTEALLSAIPIPDPKVARNRIILKGDVPSPVNPPKGCSFHTRCPYAREYCMKAEPPLAEIYPGHFSACHYSTELYPHLIADPTTECGGCGGSASYIGDYARYYCHVCSDYV